MNSANALVRALRDPDERVRWEAGESLAAIGWEPPNIEQAARFAVAVKDWPAIRKLGSEAVPVLVATFVEDQSFVHNGAYANIPSQELRCQIADLLGEIGGQRAGAALRPVLDESPGLSVYLTSPSSSGGGTLYTGNVVIGAAIRALGQMADPEAAEALAIKAMADDDRAEACIGAVEAILLQRAAEVPRTVLENLAELKDVKQAHYHDSMWADDPHEVIVTPIKSTEIVDCSKVRQLARAELLCRVS